MVWITGFIFIGLIIAADFAPSEPVEDPWRHLLVGCCCLILAPSFAVVQSLMTTRRWADRDISQPQATLLHRTLMGTNLAVWFAGCSGLLLVARWPQLFRVNWQLSQIPLVDELALGIPMLGSLFISWVVIFDAETALNFHDQGTFKKRMVVVYQRTRTLGGLLLVPITLLFLCRDCVLVFFPHGMAPPALLFLGIVFLAGLLVVYPLLISKTWQTSALSDSKLRCELQKVASEAGLQREKTMKWNTNATVMNALIVGSFPGTRRVLLSDALLSNFQRDEVAAIYRHELGHLIYHHQSMRLALMLVPILGVGALLYGLFPDGVLTVSTDFALAPAFIIAGFVGAMVYYSQVVLRFNRKSEIQADIYAITDGRGNVSASRADAYCRALLKMAMYAPEMYEHSTGMHPSIRCRLEAIRQVIRDRTLITVFHNQFHRDQRVASVGLFVWIILTVLIGWAI